MKNLLSELYQVLGGLNAPENVMNQVLAASLGEPLPHETLLPFVAANMDSEMLNWLTSHASGTFDGSYHKIAIVFHIGEQDERPSTLRAAISIAMGGEPK